MKSESVMAILWVATLAAAVSFHLFMKQEGGVAADGVSVRYWRLIEHDFEWAGIVISDPAAAPKSAVALLALVVLVVALIAYWFMVHRRHP